MAREEERRWMLLLEGCILILRLGVEHFDSIPYIADGWPLEMAVYR